MQNGGPSVGGISTLRLPIPLPFKYSAPSAFPMGVSLKKLLIKSKLIFVHRRVQQSFLDTILRLTAKAVPTVQNKLGTKYPNLRALTWNP